MSRPLKWRKVCQLPAHAFFGPLGVGARKNHSIEMTVDEFECIRLIDYEGLNQEACAKSMNVARTTVQGIYAEARRKLAILLVESAALRIEGGEYQLCDGKKNHCHCKCNPQK